MKKYKSIEWLRAIASVCIVLLHVNANGGYYNDDSIISTIFTSFADLVYLFMIISAFGVCNGYYEKFVSNQVSIFDFYKKRIKKILPFFTLLIVIDLIFNFTTDKLYEAFADLTLFFGFLPINNLSVIGVAWTLGVIFVFYFMFPFFCYMISDKKRTWTYFFIFGLFSLTCSNYFKIGSTNFLYDIPYFLVGCIIFLYKDKLNKKIFSVSIPISLIIYYYFKSSFLTTLLVNSSLLIGFLCLNEYIKFDNKLIRTISKYSMELYLSHMAFFRLYEKVGLLYLFSNITASFIFAVLLIVLGSVLFAIIFNKILMKVNGKID